MKVLIDVSPIKKAGGSTRHLQNFITHLDKTSSNNQYFLTVNKNIKDFKLPTNLKKVNIIYIDTFSIYKQIKHLFYAYRKIIKMYEIDIIVSMVNLGFIKSPIPQLNFQRNPAPYCKYHLKSLKFSEKVRVYVERVLLNITMNNSVYVITPTLAMQNMINDFIINKIKFIVLPHAINYQELINPNELPEGIGKIFKKDGFTKILYVSHFIPHKNHISLLSAVNLLKQRDWNIKLYLIIDKNDWSTGYNSMMDEIKKFNLEENIELLPRIPASEVSNLYLMSDIFAFPSLCESFGFPMMEAMACKLPLVVADTPVNREICGNAALYHDPYSSVDLANNIETFLKNPELILEYKDKSYEQFNNSNVVWDEYIKKLENILENILSDTGKVGNEKFYL